MPLDATGFQIETKPDLSKPAPFSLEHFTEWLGTKPKNNEYCFMDHGNCAWAQYIKENGIDPAPSVGGTGWFGAIHGYHRLPEWTTYVVTKSPHIFSAAHSRALKLLADRKQMESEK